MTGNAQVVYEDINHTGIYEFLDELANLKVITINSVIKPYSRKFIAEKLQEAWLQKDQLNRRQQKEIAFYMQDYQLEKAPPVEFRHRLKFLFRKKSSTAVAINPVGFLYKDSSFTLSVRPVYGMTYFYNNNGSAFHRYGGAEGFAYLGKHLGGYANLRDNHENVLLAKPGYFTRRQGGVYKETEDGGADYSEMRGGITYTWKWGSIGIIKDNIIWGNNYHGSNIFSGRIPSFAQIKLYLKPVKWFEFNYFHGWLVSEVIDSARSYTNKGEYREVYHSKYLAANMYTLIPWRGLNVSFGNSIIYSDIGIQPAYLIPFIFFKSVDHTLNGTNNQTGQNSQMFFDISSRQIKHLHLYLSLFMDDLMIGDLFKRKYSDNLFSTKAGFRISNLLVPNTHLTFEYTQTSPLVYQHFFSTTDYTSNQYNLGHYLKDNSRELYLDFGIKPLRGLTVKLAYIFAQHGKDYVYDHSDEFIRMIREGGFKFMDEITWKRNEFILSSGYEITNKFYVTLKFSHSVQKGNVQYSPELFHGTTNTLIAGFNLNF